MVGFILLAIIVFSVVVVPFFIPDEHTAINPRQRLKPPSWLSGDGSGYLMGTDQLGRDMLARALQGGRLSLLVGLSAVAVSGVIGVVLGLVAGYYGGWFDNLVMRIADVQLAIPTILLAILVMATLGSNVVNLVIVMSIAGWMIFARLIRANTMSLKAQTFVEAAHALGAEDSRILFKHILRNAWTPILIVATQQVAQLIVLESSLSFLGVGVPPDVPTWGAMVRDGRLYLELAWWVSAVPGALLALTVLAINFLGDGLRDVLDPGMRS